MGEMGYGYGSECHLLRWMGRHRKQFDETVASAVGRPGAPLDWLDFRFRGGGLWPDAELVGMEFLQNNPAVWNAWQAFWPQTGTAQTWDAVGWLGPAGDRELVLIEAKARIGEDGSSCKAKGRGREMIEAAFELTKEALGVHPTRDWMNGSYQYTNRIAALHFLNIHCDALGCRVPARLLFLYFVGDLTGRGRNCPQDEAGWLPSLHLQAQHIGLPEMHPLVDRIHRRFLPVLLGPGEPVP